MRYKNVNISRTKRAFNMKQKTFFIIFKELSLEEIKTTFLEGESATLNFSKNTWFQSSSACAVLLFFQKSTRFKPSSPYLDLYLMQYFPWSCWHMLPIIINIIKKKTVFTPSRPLLDFLKKDVDKTKQSYLDL